MNDFSHEFLAAVVDTLLPGLSATESQAALPAAAQIGVDRQLADHLVTHPQRDRLAQRLQTLAQLAGGVSNFVASDEATRTVAMQALEQMDGPAFYAFLLVIAADYYQTDEVIRAMQWYVDPPQPRGYPLPPFDEARLATVKAREKLWRA